MASKMIGIILSFNLNGLVKEKIATPVPPPNNAKSKIKGIMALLDLLAPSVFNKALLLAAKASFVRVL